ncbi:MAG: ClbS/DfsB family four-helix bundle protein [Anaerolineales bacterium]|jgi:tetratricopeptide (TPR) repeat protein
MTRRQEILLLLAHCDGKEIEFTRQLSEPERRKAGTPQAWSAKDLIAHISAWKEDMTTSIEAFREGRERERRADIDMINGRIFAENRDLPWEQVLDKRQETSGRLQQQVSLLEENKLREERQFGWPENRPLWRHILGSGYSHPILHLAQFSIGAGRSKQAVDWMEATSEELEGVDPDPSWRGVVRYNRACVYALAGGTERALEELRLAFRLNSSLMEWSQQDTDLAPLHHLTEFKELVGR